jgi:hypothetical protein
MDDNELLDSRRLAAISTTAELLKVGLTATGIRSLVKRGVLTDLGRGVYARADLAAKLAKRPNGDRMLLGAAAVTAAGAGTVASHTDAAIIHGLALLDRPTATITVTRRPGVNRTGRPGTLVHAAALPDSQVTIRDGIPVTTVARTVVDLARTTPFGSGVVTADSALRARKTSKAKLRAVISTMNRWPGIGTARLVVDFANAKAESPFESIARVAFRDWGLPPPVLHAEVGDDEVVGRVDFFWPDHATIAEADGAAKYADPARAMLQLDRDARLRQAGFEVVHFTWHDLHANPHLVRQWILDAFGRQAVLRAATT